MNDLSLLPTWLHEMPNPVSASSIGDVAAHGVTEPNSQVILAAGGGGLIDMSHWIFYIIVGIGCAYFLGGGIVRGMRDHWKKGEGAAFKAILGGVGLAILITHIVGIYQRGNSEVEKAPGGWFNGGNGGSVSVNRGW